MGVRRAAGAHRGADARVVAVGSTLATILLTSDVSFVEGAVALALLLVLQVVIAALVARSRRVRSVVTAAPALLAWNGQIDCARLSGEQRLADRANA